MKRLTLLLSVLAVTAFVAHGQNLLLNGDFNSPNSTASADHWATWSFGEGWASHELITPAPTVLGNYDGSYQMTLGGFANAGGGVYQIVPAGAGISYTLSVDAGAQNWWLPTGEIRLFFLDASDAQLGLTQINTTDSIHNGSNGGIGDQYDIGVAYQTWSFNAAAPSGTTQAKIEFAGFGGGSCWFDNASLTVVPEPSAMALMAVGSVFMIAARRRISARRA